MADTVTVKDPYGQLGLVDKAKLDDALKHGYQVAPDSEIQAYNDKQEYGHGITNALGAFAENAAGTATFGLSRELENATGLTTPEAQAARQKYNPVSSAAGFGAGIIAPLALAPEAVGVDAANEGLQAAKATGDAAKIAEAEQAVNTAKNTLTAGDALNPVSAVSKIGGKVTQAATRALPEGAGLASEILAKVPGAALGSAVEGAAYGLGQSVTEDALGDPGLNAEKIMSNVGYGALLGGALGGALKVGEIAIPPALSAAKDAITNTTERIFGPAGEVGPISKAYAKASSFISGKPEESILEGLRNRQDLIENPEAREKVASDFAGTLQEHVDKVNEAVKRANQDIRPEEIQKSLEGMDRGAAMEQHLGVWQKVHDLADHMEQHPALYPANVTYKLRALSEEFKAQGMNARSAGDVYSAINELKQNIDKQFRIFGRTIDPAYADAANGLKGLRSDIKNNLENESVWGQAGARQAAFNDAQNQLMHLSGKGGDFNKAFLVKVPTRTGGFRYEVSPNKVKTFFNQVKDLRGQEKAEALQNFIDSSKSMVGEIEKTYKSVPDRTWNKAGVDSVIEKNYTQAQTAIKQAELQKNLGMLGAGGHNAYLGEGAAVGMGAFHPALGAAVEAFTMARNPGLAIQRLAKLERMAQKTSEIVSRGAQAIFKKSAATGGDLAGVVGGHFVPSGDAMRPAAANDHKRGTVEALNELQNNPEKLFNVIHDATKDVADHAPHTAIGLSATASAATQFLQSKAPQSLPNGPLSPPLQPSKSEIAKFGRYLGVIEEPTSVLAQVKDCTITPESVEALSAVYPKLYSEMKQSVMQAMVDHAHDKESHAVPYAKRLALSLFLGTDVDSSLGQESIFSNQMVFAKGSQGMAPQGAMPKGKSKALALDDDMRTPAQASAEREGS